MSSYNGPDRRRFNWYPLVGYVILLIAVVTAVYMIQGSAIERERQAQLVQCERVQLLRDQSNGVNFLIYDYFKEAAEAQTEAAKIEKDPKQKEVRLSTAARLQRTADTTVVTGPTDCNQAVNNPTEYSAPAPSFIAEDNAQVKEAKRRAAEIINKAETDTPLYQPTESLEDPAP
jgi:hypothetical protein